MARTHARARDTLCFAREGVHASGSRARHTSSSASYFSSIVAFARRVFVSLCVVRRALLAARHFFADEGAAALGRA